jgi:hypothetical protein
VTNQHLLLDLWEKECVKLEIPSIYIIDLGDGSARGHVELLEGLRLTPSAHTRIGEILDKYETWGGAEAREVRFVGASERIEGPVAEILSVCREDRALERQQSALAAIPRPFEGMAYCVNNEGWEDRISVGEAVYIREIPNQADHCVVLKSGTAPMVSIDIHRFELPFPYQSF